MKFICVSCQTPMRLTSPAAPQGAGVAMSFRCDSCGQGVALQTNPGEADLLRDLGLRLTSQPGASAMETPPPLAELIGEPTWTEAAQQRLAAIPSFIQPMVRKSYADYAREHGHAEITPVVMDAARANLDVGGFMK